LDLKRTVERIMMMKLSYSLWVSLVTQWKLKVPNIWTPRIPYRSRKNSKNMVTLQICSPDRLKGSEF